MDVGMALLMLRPLTPPYVDTLHLANHSPEPFTQVERQRHGTDHTLIGAAIARTWGVSQTVLLATSARRARMAKGQRRKEYRTG